MGVPVDVPVERPPLELPPLVEVLPAEVLAAELLPPVELALDAAVPEDEGPAVDPAALVLPATEVLEPELESLTQPSAETNPTKRSARAQFAGMRTPSQTRNSGA